MTQHFQYSHHAKRFRLFFILLAPLGLLAILLAMVKPGHPTSPALTPMSTDVLDTRDRSSRRGDPIPEVRGVYLPSVVAANAKKLDELMKSSHSVGFNALVIDIKDNRGTLAYNSKVPLAQKIGARSNLLELTELLPYLKKLGFYVIARQVVFYDPRLANYLRPLNTAQELNRWVSPADERIQQYNMAIAEEAAAAGFDELQFDYVRWPDGGAYQPVYAERYAAIEQFLKRVHERLHKKIRLSADVFGRTLWSWNIKKIDPIGQHLEAFRRYLDVLSPMIYPSHYETEAFRSDPYGTVKKAVENGFERQLMLRPFLQAFEMHIPARLSYRGYIRAQVRAVRELGLKGYLFWNPRGDYAQLWDALK